MRGPVADWPKPEKGANPNQVRAARRQRSREERLTGICNACGDPALSVAVHLCARCWHLVPREIAEHAAAAGFLLGFGDPVAEEYGREWSQGPSGYGLLQTLERRHRTALIFCEVAARVLGAGDAQEP